MEEINKIKELINIFRTFYTTPKKITLFYEPYFKFKEKLEDFIHCNHLENTSEWMEINKNLVHTSNQYMVESEANIILYNLNEIKNKLLQQIYSADTTIFNLLHSEVQRISKKAFINGLYTESVRSAFIEIENKLNKIYYKETHKESHGQQLVRVLFKLENPLFVFNDLENETQKNEQEGYCNIFAGAMQAIRNEKAHHNTPITKEEAIKRLMLASLLFDKIDSMKKNSNYHSKDIT